MSGKSGNTQNTISLTSAILLQTNLLFKSCDCQKDLQYIGFYFSSWCNSPLVGEAP